MLFYYHLKELQFRFLYLFLLFFSLTFIGYLHKPTLFAIFIFPISTEIEHFLSLHPYEVIWCALLNSCTMAGLFILPFLYLHFTLYISSSLYTYELRLLFKLLLFSCILIYGSTFCIYYYFLPLLFHYLINLGGPHLTFEAHLWDYSLLLLKLLIGITLSNLFPFLLYACSFKSHRLIRFRGIYSLFIGLTFSIIMSSDRDFLIGLGTHFLIYEILIYLNLWKETECIGNRTQGLRVKSP